MINVTLLGTSCMVPTKERNVTSFYLEYKGEGILVDCGEGTQRQLNIVGIPRNKVKKILISHWHADHVSGILGLIHTISNDIEEPSIEVFGPKETKKRFQSLMDSTYYGKKINIVVKELDPTKLTKFYENEDYYLETAPLNHKIPTLGFTFVEKDRRKIAVSKTTKLGIPEGPLLGDLQKGKLITFKDKKYKSEDLTYIVKGKKVGFIMDTAQIKTTLDIANEADLLICEASYMDQHLEKGEQYYHLTAKQAALIAQNANAKKLVMTHFSQRYKQVSDLEQEAKDIFPESYAGFDLMKLKV